MTNSLGRLGGIRQIGYVTGDVFAAAQARHNLTGAGPFFIMRGVQFLDWKYHGVAQDITLDIAFGQDGDAMIELISPSGSWPNIYGDAPMAGGNCRIHHHGYLVEDIAANAAHIGETVVSAALSPAAQLRYVDCRSTLGLYVELIHKCPETEDFFALSSDAASDWDGSGELLRTLPD